MIFVYTTLQLEIKLNRKRHLIHFFKYNNMKIMSQFYTFKFQYSNILLCKCCTWWRYDIKLTTYHKEMPVNQIRISKFLTSPVCAEERWMSITSASAGLRKSHQFSWQPLWSRSSIVASHTACPGSMPGWVSLLAEVSPGFPLNRKTNVRKT